METKPDKGPPCPRCHSERTHPHEWDEMMPTKGKKALGLKKALVQGYGCFDCWHRWQTTEQLTAGRVK